MDKPGSADGDAVCPPADDMDVARYLQRIGAARPAAPTAAALRSLHRRHLLTVPFENLSQHCGGRSTRATPDLRPAYDKIVDRRRGGFCYENNGLFAWLLTRLGFEVTLLAAQVRNTLTGRYGPPFDHLVSMVVAAGSGGRWLCDVGFGGTGFAEPLSLEVRDEPQTQGHLTYRIREDGDGDRDGVMRVLEVRGEGVRVPEGCEWAEMYKFTLAPRRREDFARMCEYHQSSPSSIFFCKSLCSILRPNGRLTYMGHRLIATAYPTEHSPLETTTRDLKDEEIPVVLENEFGVVLGAPLIPKDQDIVPPSVTY